MSAMPEHAGATTLPLPLPRGRPLTTADIDGTLIVSPAPAWIHQRVVVRLSHLLERARPTDDFEVLVAPFDVKLADDTVLQPDVLVARYSDMSNRWSAAAPPLAVEVLSPSSRRVDLGRKRPRLERARCPSYWVVDPDEPSLLAWELRDSEYVEVGKVHGDETFHARLPYPVEVTPCALVERREA